MGVHGWEGEGTMRVWARNGNHVARHGLAAALLSALGLIGCNKQPQPTEQGATTETAVVASTEAPNGAVAENKDGSASAPLVRDAMHQAFEIATRGGDDPPPNSNPPPNVTASGKAVYKIYKEVLALWDTIRFTTADGKPIHYSATLETDHGVIEIALRPDLAPNHVRNFVALARAGYYDDLLFERICHEENEIEPGKVQVFDSIEAGCPLGTGEPGNGSIGYWLKPEFPAVESKVTHEVGTVGACRADEPDSAACRFYITLCDAPFLDGNFTVFGKVTRGLDAAHTIAKQPTREYEEDVAGSLRPDKPIKIKKVTIHTSVEESGR
jgi:cyclophilin family peptidyl-prolyl cis-trans isomerase